MIIVSVKKANGVNKSVVATIRNNKHEGNLLNKKNLRHSIIGFTVKIM